MTSKDLQKTCYDRSHGITNRIVLQYYRLYETGNFKGLPTTTVKKYEKLFKELGIQLRVNFCFRNAGPCLQHTLYNMFNDMASDEKYSDPMNAA